MKRKFFTNPIIPLALIIVVVTVTVFFVVKTEINAEKEWNNGVCLKCGSKYHYEQAVGHGNSTGYIYRCDNGHLIEIGKYVNQ